MEARSKQLDAMVADILQRDAEKNTNVLSNGPNALNEKMDTLAHGMVELSKATIANIEQGNTAVKELLLDHKKIVDGLLVEVRDETAKVLAYQGDLEDQIKSLENVLQSVVLALVLTDKPEFAGTYEKHKQTITNFLNLARTA